MPKLRFKAKDIIMVGETRLSPELFPELLRRHPRDLEATLQLEEQAQPVRSGRFNRQQLRDFIRAVCLWGGYPKTAERVLRSNPFPEVRRHFQRASRALAQSEPNLRWALRELGELRGLGVPFASKHMRFLQPQHCPVLDHVLSQELDYRLNGRGYQIFAEDCQRIADILQGQRLVNPLRREKRAWFAADVEMALYVWVKENLLEQHPGKSREGP